MLERIRKVLDNRRGAFAVLAAISMTAMMGFAALATDVGMLYANRVQLTNLTDAAVLAGAQDLPGNASQAVASANSYAGLNGKAGDKVDVNILNNGTIMTARASRTVPMIFARVLGVENSVVTATAAALISPVGGMDANIVPFGLVKQNLVYGQDYKLKLGAGDGYQGNFAALALGGNGASVYRDNIKFGHNGPIKAGDWITTETGDMSGPTKQGVQYRISLDSTATFDSVEKGSPRIITVPVIDSIQVNGRNEVLVVGFAAMFLEDFTGGGPNSFVIGKFIKMTVPGDGSGSAGNWGLYSAKLIPYQTSY